jgi:hypothetical protein
MWSVATICMGFFSLLEALHIIMSKKNWVIIIFRFVYTIVVPLQLQKKL